MKKKILIIEDDPIIGHIYKSRLEKDTFEVEVTQDGPSGLARVGEFKPDAVLLDLMLPKMGGVEILKKIRAQAQFSRTPVIVFTNAYVPNMIQDAMSAGATQVFNKATLTPRRFVEALLNATTTSPPVQGASGTSGSASKPAAAVKASATAPPLPTEPEKVQFVNFRPGSKDANYIPVPSDIPYETTLISGSDTKFQKDLLRMFKEGAPESLLILRKYLQEFSKTQEENGRMTALLELYRRVHAITGSAGMAGLHAFSQITAALEVLLKELYDKPKNINVSTTRTVATAVDFISEMLQKGLDPEWSDLESANILVVDDEILSRRAISYALEKVSLKCNSVEDAQVALNLATERTYDLIFMDIQMPGMDGYDLCTRILSLPKNKSTPVIFVTTLVDFSARAKSTLSGGKDLIAKPFMFIELSVKALTYVMKGQLAKRLEHRKAA